MDNWVVLLWRTVLLFLDVSPGKRVHEFLLAIEAVSEVSGLRGMHVFNFIGWCKWHPKAGVTKWWLTPTSSVWGCMLLCSFTLHLTNTWCCLTLKYLPIRWEWMVSHCDFITHFPDYWWTFPHTLQAFILPNLWNAYSSLLPMDCLSLGLFFFFLLIYTFFIFWILILCHL